MSVWICMLILMGIAKANGWTVPLWCGLLWAAMTGGDLIIRLIEIRDTIRKDEEGRDDECPGRR